MIRSVGLHLVRLTFALISLHVSQANAHTYPVTGSPPPDAVLTNAPASASLTFSGVLEPTFSGLTVKNAAGAVVASTTVRSAHSKTIEVKLPALTKGTYYVNWFAVARDGHRAQGKHKFFVR